MVEVTGGKGKVREVTEIPEKVPRTTKVHKNSYKGATSETYGHI